MRLFLKNCLPLRGVPFFLRIQQNFALALFHLPFCRPVAFTTTTPARQKRSGVFNRHRPVPFGNSNPIAGPVIVHRPCKVLGLGPLHDGEAPSLRKLQPGDGCHWAHPPMSKINLRHHSPPRAQTRKEKSIREGISPPRTVGMIAKRRFCVNCGQKKRSRSPRQVASYCLRTVG